MSARSQVAELAAFQDAVQLSNEAATGTRWPKIDDAAFHGLVGRIVRKIEPHSEADPVAILLQFLVLFGNLIGRSAHFQVEADQHYLNLFAVIVGETSIGRKGVALGQAKRLLVEADPEWAERCVKRGGLSSGEGLIQAVRDPVEEMVTDKEHGDHKIPVDEGAGDKRLLVVEAEFVSVLRTSSREGNVLSAVLRNCWESGDLQTLTRKSPLKATGAHVSIIGHITKGELLGNFNSVEAANGFGNRFLWCCARRSNFLPDGGDLESVDWDQERAALLGSIEIAKNCGVLKKDSEAQILWREVYADLTGGRSGLFGAVVARAAPQVMKLACLYALLDRSTIIKRCHLEAALAVWRYCESSALWIFGRASGDSVADQILRLLRANPVGLTRSEIGDLFGRHKQKEVIESALSQLKDQGLAFSEQTATGGRPVVRWRACESGTKVAG